MKIVVVTERAQATEQKTVGQTMLYTASCESGCDERSRELLKGNCPKYDCVVAQNAMTTTGECIGVVTKSAMGKAGGQLGSKRQVPLPSTRKLRNVPDPETNSGQGGGNSRGPSRDREPLPDNRERRIIRPSPW